ncbi:MAG TPA: nuclear transport factor 2 family protein [Myxococcota bacterium]|nr:nuclear transport factor 2 family protein [Myxococcota bacterium]
MSHVRKPREAFLALIDGVGAQRWEELPDLYAIDASVRHPFATDASAHLVGRDQLREHFRNAGKAGITMKAEDVTVHETRDPEVVIGELTYRGHDRQGAGFEVGALFVLRVRGGEIVESRDYFGPRRALGPQR